jgi:predicted RNA-binding protein with PUA-like domain
MKVGDLVLFYHSNADPAGIAGVATVSTAATADESQFKKKSEYFEPRATRAKPVWYCVTIAFKQKFPRLIPLAELRGVPALKDLALLRKGQRLSIQPVSAEDFACIVRLSHH